MARSYSREYAASPSFRWTNANAISDDNTLNVDWESYNTTSAKYLPFNFTRIINNSSYDIEFYPNQDTNQVIPVPAGTIQSIDRRSIPALRRFGVKRAETGTIAAGEIIIQNSKEAQDTDSVVGRLHQRLFGDRSI